MDSDISRWVMEFLLRSSVPDSLLQKTLTALPLCGADSRLKKTLLLRTLRSLLRTASLPETALQILEQLEHLNSDIPVSDALCRAYCAVAVECTVKYLAASPDGEFSGAIRRIWRGRVAALEARGSGLVSGELKRWRNDIDAAIGDSRVRERLAGLNSRRDAMIEVRAYLKEAWETMGPSFLEKVAAMLRKKGEDVHDIDNNRTDNDNVGDHDNDGACMEDVSMQLHDENQGKEPFEERVDAHVEVGGCDLTPQRDKVAIPKRKPPFKHKHSALRASHRGVKISGPEEVESTTSCSKHDAVPSAEVRNVQESLKTSFLELRALVKDPLPDALHTSEVVRSKLATSDTNIVPPFENQSEYVDVPDPNVCQSIVLFQPSSANLEKKPSVRCSNIRRPNLMEQNSSARTFEWDDSVDNSPQARQPRRRKRKWSSLEEETLRTGVKMFGEGNWATIRSFYSNIFENRSGVDLKDKWRNMIR
ncbi:hypothetical protein VNO78_27999 [Psophocarpus tetragonolobus]|uniref:Uncharacterized protein n=1 Tax=Psophocarpus tetragonolobus TaxID=3891 RepID=A0AAN9XCU1_PSOTE